MPIALPLDCTVTYHPNFLEEEAATTLYRTLLDDYRLHEARSVVEAGGKRFVTDSFRIMFATEALLALGSHPEDRYGTNHPWEGPMAALRQRVESLTGRTFELAMCLYYPDGTFFAPWHRDQETSGADTLLPSLSLGEVREFRFRANADDCQYGLDLAHGSLLLMGKHCQSRYQHTLVKDPKYQGGRINITFREPNFQ